ncbi:uncharacterized protein [Periplaneta americana]|uniref:uncharacterized protein isoform X2 n=1 Tax=Periplaneta americana TaxID=6978 RepID=UPI0037E98556
MDEIKMEPEVDLFGLQRHDSTCEKRENADLSEDGNLSHLEVAGIKAEFVDRYYDLTSEIKVEDTPQPFSFPKVKAEVESTPVPITSPMVKSEVDEDPLDLDRVQQEEKVEVTSKEDEFLLESWCDVSANSREKAESDALAALKVIEIGPATSKVPTRSVHSL